MGKRRLRLIVVLGASSLGLLVVSAAGKRGNASRALSETEMAAIRGRELLCQDGEIYTEDYQWDCISLYSLYDNECDAKKCMSGNTDCGSGTHWTNNYIHPYELWGNVSYDEELKTDTQKTCYYTVDCETGSEDETLNCFAGYDAEGCGNPAGAPVTGCVECWEGQADLDSFVSKTDPYYDECPYEPEE